LDVYFKGLKTIYRHHKQP